MKGGRPTKYDAEKYESLKDAYLRSFQNSYKEFASKGKKHITGVNTHYGYDFYSPVPSIQGFADFCGIHRSTIYDWIKKYSEFSDMVRHIQEVQTEQIIQSGINGLCCTRNVVLLLFSNGYLK